MALTNSNISYTGLVEKYIGSAYDKMSEIHDNLREILLIAGSIEDGSFQEVADIADELQTVIDKINHFNSTYYGAYSTAPVLDPMGNPITDGDLYYDTSKELMYVYSKDFWIPLGAAEQHVEVVPLTPGLKNEATNEYEVYLDTPYIVGRNNLSVHINRVHHISTSVDSTYGTYREIDSHHIYVDAAAVQPNDILVAHVGSEAATVTHIAYVSKVHYVTRVANEELIQLPHNPDGSELTYIPGNFNLEVHLARDFQNPDHIRHLQHPNVIDKDGNMIWGEYEEVDHRHIKFNTPLEQGTEVLFTVGIVTSNAPERYNILMQDEKPNELAYEPGQLWFKTDTARMYILYRDSNDFNDVTAAGYQWISTGGEDIVIESGYQPPADPLPIAIHGTVFQNTPPPVDGFSEGTLWFNTSNATLHILYADKDSAQWMKVSPGDNNTIS